MALSLKKPVSDMIRHPISAIQLLPYTVADGVTNMAVDEYLLSLPGTILRFYGWETPMLSFGRLNRLTDDIDFEFCRSADIQGIKRISGGKTVFHQHELTYVIASDTDRFPSSIQETYHIISQPLADAFARFKLNPAMSPDKQESSDSSICFKEVSPFELTIGNKKIVGSAQFRRKNRFMQHGSILLDIDWIGGKKSGGFLWGQRLWKNALQASKNT
ncbi:MAG: hypothetical protein HQ517_03025 [SAR324 cluster bacterium]|nr:hypothetical protein [SAR324 cluster bacterium]